MEKPTFIEKNKKINWKKGSAELIGIAISFPVLCVMILVVIGIMQTGIIRQSLEYANYMAARAAVTSAEQTTAQQEAYTTAKMTLESSTFGVDIDRLDVSLELVGGTSSTIDGSGIKWEKGALVKCQTRIPYKSLVDFQYHEMASTLYLMVEQPAKTYD